MKLSIIIPFFNAELYFKELLDSLMPQINNEVEVIFVNDASTDESVKFVSKYLALQNVILIENDVNKCVSYSRNRALEIARGEYIWFVDVDDIIPNNAINTILNKINSLDADIDIILTDFNFFDDSAEIIKIELNHYPYDEYPTVNHEYDDKFWVLYEKLKICSMNCNCLFKRKLLKENDIIFNEKICSGETWFLKTFALWYAKTFDFIDDSIYIFRINRRDRNSLSQSINYEERLRETLEESIVEYNTLFDMFYSDYPKGVGRDKMLTLMAHSFWQAVIAVLGFEKISNIQELHDRNFVKPEDYDKILKYENITWQEVLTDEKYSSV